MGRAKGINGTIEFDGRTVTSRRDGVLARGTHGTGTRTIPLGSIASVQWRSAGLTAGQLSIVTMRAEAEFIAAFEAVDTVDADEDRNGRLTLRGDDVRLVFRSYDMNELLTTTWSITDVATGDTIDSVLPGTEPILTFAEDGRLRMAMRCATATSSWELDGHALSVDPLRPTRRSCTTPPRVVGQEAALVRALESADKVEIAPGELTILDADDSIALVAANDRHG